MGERSLRGAIVCLLAFAGIARADALQPDELAKKNEGGYFTGLPLFAYSTDLGFGVGARAYYFWNGDRKDPRFAQTTYLYRVFLQAFVSTRGTQFHWLDFDAPKVFSSPYRLRSQLILQRDTSSNYFGLGDRSLRPLHFPGSTQDFAKFSDYSAAEAQVENGTTYEKYDQYDLLRPLVIASIERLVLNDRVRLLAGLGFSYARVRDYSGKEVQGATEGETRLAEDCAAGLVVGCHGGRDDYVRLGISYDTRDYEPDPNKGVFIDAGLDLGTVALGSQYDYARFLVTARGYWSPFPSHADLVLAGRALIQMQTSDTPFFSMNTLPFTDDPRSGLGGHRTLRGYRQDRFVGPVMTLVNGEVRWTFAHATIWKQKFGFIVAPFVDDGRPYDSLSDLSVHDWQLSYGGALRISWNLATLVTIDYGRSHEDTGFYVNFNHIF
ncbi:MAG TPA: DUF5982 domain-containing protein [Kofleriaceae bacterium]